MATIHRVAAGLLSLSALGLTTVVLNEDFVPVANKPVEGDPCTGGYGSTVNKDGTPVKCGQRFTPAQAVDLAAHHISKDEEKLRKCVTGKLSQVEWDILVDFSYQYGVKRACESSMVKAINKGDYKASCDSYLLYKKVRGFDCSTPGNKVCGGVWTRSQERHKKCMAEVEKLDKPLDVTEHIKPEPKSNAWVVVLFLLGVGGFFAWRKFRG